MTEPFSDREMEALKRAARCSTGSIDCPHCGAPLDQREVPPRPDVSYVRERIWLLCGNCDRSAIIDQPGRKGGG
ncbi:MAG: hypothetical protein R3223_02170 [Longimicrobiales bacterium]|nr:hypothetical protein [Longimicrobiales bacterium]